MTAQSWRLLNRQMGGRGRADEDRALLRPWMPEVRRCERRTQDSGGAAHRRRRAHHARIVLDRHAASMHPVAATGSRAIRMRAIAAPRAESFPIGVLSRLSGVNIETIRYYER